jgi:hypothetical protein
MITNIFYLTTLAPLIFSVVYLLISIVMYRRSIFQKKLANVGLESYQVSYFFSFVSKSLVIEPKKNEEMDISFIRNNCEEFIQIWGYDVTKDIKIEPYRKDKVKITQLANLPDSISFNINKLKEDYFYLGKLASGNKIEDLYIPFDSILHTAILGTSGGGKSVFLKLFLSNIFYHYKKIDKLYFVDFKGGIASKPFVNVANRLNIQESIITCHRDLQKLHEVLTDISQVNEERMSYLTKNDLEKWTDDYIFLIFDEMAEILNYEAIEKEEKEFLKQIVSMINSLFTTGRSQNIRIVYAVQSYVKDASGVNTTIKTNTSTKFLFKTQQSTSISSVVSNEDLEEIGVNPKNLKTGEALLLDNESIQPLKFKSAFIDNRTDDALEQIIKYSKKPKSNKFKDNIIMFMINKAVLFLLLIVIIFLYVLLPKPTIDEWCSQDSKYYKIINGTKFYDTKCEDYNEKSK